MSRPGKLIKYFLSSLLLCNMAFHSLSINAEQVLKTEQYSIHYNAFNSAMLSAEVANRFGIKRSTSQGIINISVINTDDMPVIAFIKGDAKNPLSQLKTLKFNKITEGEAIYYVAPFTFADKEQLIFNIIVVPENETRTINLNFSQQFFVG